MIIKIEKRAIGKADVALALAMLFALGVLFGFVLEFHETAAGVDLARESLDATANRLIPGVEP